VVIEAVTFDFWNTLMYEEAGHLRGRRLGAWLGILEEAGFAVERQRLDAAFDDSWDHYVTAWKANQQFSAVDAAERILDRLGFDVPDGVRRELLVAFREAGNEAEIRPAPNASACLARLNRAGVRIGIVCDVGMTPSTALRRHLDRHGLLEHFAHWSFSDEVGVYKPAPAIFEHALAGLGGVAPDRAAHVGDLRRTDVAGAKAMGMTAVRYTGVFDDDTVDETDAPEADHVVADLAAVPTVLGLNSTQ
jgi:putative hydrolase of the HAD superfamily